MPLQPSKVDMGGASDYYYVEVDCGTPVAGTTAVSNSVGEFSFTIVPGD